MKKLVFLYALLIFSIAVGSIRFLEDNDYIDERFTLLTNIDNTDQDAAIDGVKVKYLFLGNDMQGGSRAVRIGPGDNIANKIHAPLEDSLPPGEYLVRIYVYSDDGDRRIKHRPIIIQ